MSNVKVGDLVKLFASPSYKRIWDAIVIDSVKGEDGKVLFNYVVSPNPNGSIQICINILSKGNNPEPHGVENEWKWTKVENTKENIWVSDEIFVKGDVINFSIAYWTKPQEDGGELKYAEVKFPFKINSAFVPKQEETTEPEPEEPGEEPEEPEIPEDEPLEDGVTLWGDMFGSFGSTGTKWDNISTYVSDYDRSGIEGKDENINVTYTGNENVKVVGTGSTGVNDSHLWFNTSTYGFFETSEIKLYNATKLTLTYDQGTKDSKSIAYYKIDNDWNELGSQDTNGKALYTFEVPEKTEQIYIKIEHPAENTKNTRVDNIALISGHVETQQIVEEIIAKLSKPIA